MLRNRKALSPVVAAIILIAVTVAVSIAVAAWMGALTLTFMRIHDGPSYIVPIPIMENATHCQWVTSVTSWSEVVPLPCNATFSTTRTEITLEVVYYKLVTQSNATVYVLKRLSQQAFTLKLGE